MAIDQTAAPATIGPARSGAVTESGGLTFRTLLSDLNPLQYIPVVGALYRAATGDEGNPTLRFVASLGTSFALGGPVGVGITVAEKVTGFDPERIVRSLLGHLFHHPAPATAPAASSPAAAPATPGHPRRPPRPGRRPRPRRWRRRWRRPRPNRAGPGHRPSWPPTRRPGSAKRTG
jgi:hypothetical protein